jgi:hypothetical protein
MFLLPDLLAHLPVTSFVNRLWTSFANRLDFLLTRAHKLTRSAKLVTVFRDSHNRSLEIPFAISLTTRYLQRFPRFHSVHHNNKADSF